MDTFPIRTQKGGEMQPDLAAYRDCRQTTLNTNGYYTAPPTFFRRAETSGTETYNSEQAQRHLCSFLFSVFLPPGNFD